MNKLEALLDEYKDAEHRARKAEGEALAENERLKRRNEKLKEENDTLHEMVAHYRERYQELMEKALKETYPEFYQHGTG